MIFPPGKERKLVVGRAAEHDRVAVSESAELLVELDDLGRANEGEILRVRVDDQPLAGVARRGHVRELLTLLDAHTRDGLELRELAAGNDHNAKFSNCLAWLSASAARHQT